MRFMKLQFITSAFNCEYWFVAGWCNALSRQLCHLI